MKQNINILKKLTLIFSTIYIIWRIIFTIPLKLGKMSLIFGIALIIIEIIDYIEFIIHYKNIISAKIIPKELLNLAHEKYPDIDILITTLNEEKELLKQTINGCLNLKYPSNEKVHIYICDDGNREEIKELARITGINYISREKNINAKAGNLNNALKYTKSDYILTLDADMIPKENFLIDIMPYFFNQEGKVGFVQTPQAFYNYDIYQYRLGIKNAIPFDQSFFYNCIQPAKETINATVFCGTNAIIYRKALNEIGGFATGTLTEDIATGMLIQNAGYKGLYINKIEAVGYSPNELSSFIKQRTRWALGCIQMAKKYNILNKKGLNLRQKLEYITCVSYWLFGLKTILFWLAPCFYSLFNIIIIKSNMLIFLAMWLPQYILKRFVLDYIYENKRSSTWNKIYETILAPTIFYNTLKEMLGIRKKVFEVSEKRKNKKDKAGFLLLFTHLMFFIINLITATLCFKNFQIFTILPLVWSLSNMFYLIVAIIFDLSWPNKEYLEQRKENDKYYKKGIIRIFTEIKE